MSFPPLPPPSSQDVHIWQWDLDDCGDFNLDWQILSAQERERADKFRFQLHRHRYVAGRSELKRILGRYLALPPQAIALGYGPEGKPFCAAQPPEGRICFNLSHSENTAVLAISSGFEVGVDVELVRPIEESMPLEIFSPRERAEFTALANAERQNIFFETWVRKEACLKALGTGFILPASHFEFDLASRGDTTPRLVGGKALEATHWRIRTLPVSPACVGAVAARRTGWSILKMN
ncbi:4'-phosphopantetheinyl transferase family protein [Paraburkholderia sacchari]|uniref:4'-phosphopantetheinyl transferase family protein n=1 Tax=Paraburkholderia sacchari TaxID=159450 RepID=UPI001BD0466E|nr:4'-phosphopantetheinyl transferase superfamily protein [Paraburkholderia sacchari]